MSTSGWIELRNSKHLSLWYEGQDPTSGAGAVLHGLGGLGQSVQWLNLTSGAALILTGHGSRAEGGQWRLVYRPPTGTPYEILIDGLPIAYKAHENNDWSVAQDRALISVRGMIGLLPDPPAQEERPGEQQPTQRPGSSRA